MSGGVLLLDRSSARRLPPRIPVHHVGRDLGHLLGAEDRAPGQHPLGRDADRDRVPDVGPAVPPWIQTVSSRLGPMPPCMSAPWQATQLALKIASPAATEAGVIYHLARHRGGREPGASAGLAVAISAFSSLDLRAVGDEVVVDGVDDRPDDAAGRTVRATSPAAGCRTPRCRRCRRRGPAAGSGVTSFTGRLRHRWESAAASQFGLVLRVPRPPDPDARRTAMNAAVVMPVIQPAGDGVGRSP